MVIIFAVATYFLVRLLQDRGLSPQQRSQRPKPKRRPSTPPKIVAPDDDEDFLRDLDRKRLNPEDPDS